MKAKKALASVVCVAMTSALFFNGAAIRALGTEVQGGVVELSGDDSSADAQDGIVVSDAPADDGCRLQVNAGQGAGAAAPAADGESDFFYRNARCGSSSVRLSAANGIFPADARLIAAEPNQTVQEGALAAVDALRAEGRTSYASLVCNVSVEDAQGTQLQPGEDQLVELTFNMWEAGGQDAERTIYYVMPTDDGGWKATELEGVHYKSQERSVIASTDRLGLFVVDVTVPEQQKSAPSPEGDGGASSSGQRDGDKKDDKSDKDNRDNKDNRGKKEGSNDDQNDEPGLPEGALAYVNERGDSKWTSDWKPYEGASQLAKGWYAVAKNVTLDNVRPCVTGDVNLVLCDGCKLRANKGIEVAKGGHLRIWQQQGGTGSLEATASDDNAGIGGNEDKAGGAVTINGGNVTATGDDDGAGIGGGGSASEQGSIYINGGNVKAYGGDTCGAGIGTGLDNHRAYSITINGGTVYAEGGNQAAGIGGGKRAVSGRVTINGGDVTATNSRRNLTGNGRGCGAGIGSGRDAGRGRSVTINGGTVKAYGGSNSAGIGGADETPNGPIIITGGEVRAISRVDETDEHFAWDKPEGSGAGIGSGACSAQGDAISITGGSVIAQSAGGAGIGAGWEKGAGEIHIGGSAQVLASSENGAGIGGGGRGAKYYNGGAGGNVTIDGGVVFAASKALGAGIGGGKGGAGGTVTIDGGDVTAIGGHLNYDYLANNTPVYRAAVGKDIIIALQALVGELALSSEFGGAGIGGGGHANGGTVNIKSGRVLACAGMSSANAIGRGNEGTDDGQLRVYREARVSVGSNAKSLTSVVVAERTYAAQCNPCALVEPCNHEGARFTCVSDTGHSFDCPYCECDCGKYGVEHEFDEHGRCTKCGYEHVDINLDPGEGAGSVKPLHCEKGGRFTLPGTNFKAPEGKVFAGWKATIDGVEGVYPAGSVFTLTDSITLVAQWADPYQVWVGSVQVNSHNKGDILRDGHFSYDPKTATLTVSGDAKVEDVHNGSLVSAEGLDLTIAGEGSISGGRGTSYTQAIYVRKGSLIMSGSLDITGGNEGDISYGILCERDIVLRDGSYQVTGTNSAIRARRRLYVADEVTRLEATAGKRGTSTNVLRGSMGIVLGDALKITDPKGGRVLDYRIVDASNENVKHVVISS